MDAHPVATMLKRSDFLRLEARHRYPLTTVVVLSAARIKQAFLGCSGYALMLCAIGRYSWTTCMQMAEMTY